MSLRITLEIIDQNNLQNRKKMKMNKSYLLIVLFLCGLSAGNVFAAASVAYNLGGELIAAAREGNEAEVIKLITARADVDTRTENGNTALILAALYGHTHIAELLLQAGANVNNTSYTEDTALMLAAYNGHANTVKLLLNAGADKTIKTRRGFTAETIARRHKRHNIADIIRDYVPAGRRIKSASKTE